MEAPITSRANPRVRMLRRLASRKGRDDTGLWLLEGPDFVREFVRAGLRPSILAVTPASRAECADIEASAGQVLVLSEDLMRYASATETGTGALAAVPAPSYTPDHLLAAQRPLVVVLDGIQDPGNVGACARSADALGASGLLAGPGTAEWGNPKVLRASAGALFHLPLVSTADLSSTLALMKERGLAVIAADPSGATPPWLVDWGSPCALVLGSEARGVGEGVLRLADTVVSIPHQGRVGSLNVAAAGAVLLYEAMKVRSRA